MTALDIEFIKQVCFNSFLQSNIIMSCFKLILKLCISISNDANRIYLWQNIAILYAKCDNIF